MTPDDQGGVANVLQWLPWDMGKGAVRRKQSVFPTLVLSAGAMCIEAKALRKGFLEEHPSSLAVAALLSSCADSCPEKQRQFGGMLYF